MPVSYAIEDDVLFLFLEGDYESKDIEAIFSKALSEIPAGEKINLLIDITASGSIQKHPSNRIAQTSIFIAQHKDRLKYSALLAPSDFEFGMMRVAQSTAEIEGGRDRVRAFRTTAEALAWLKREE